MHALFDLCQRTVHSVDVDARIPIGVLLWHISQYTLHRCQSRLIAAGEESLDDGFIQRILTVIKYAPNGDLDGNGCVDDADLLRLLLAFGQSGADLAEDLNGDGVVDDADLLEVLFHFGSGC
jgi:hypothetical protein